MHPPVAMDDVVIDMQPRFRSRLPEAAPTVSVIIPTLNEAENLPHVFESSPATCTRSSSSTVARPTARWRSRSACGRTS